MFFFLNLQANEIKTHVASEKHLQGYLDVNEAFGEKTEVGMHSVWLLSMDLNGNRSKYFQLILILKNLYEKVNLLKALFFEKGMTDMKSSYFPPTFEF